jgi:L-aspartate oxidase
MNGRSFSSDEVRRADVVIIGGGVAGMAAALHARGRHVLMVGKTAFAEGGSSVHAQGGIAAAVGSDDSPAEHAADTLRAGVGLCDPETVRRVTAEGPVRLAELLALGARFDRAPDGRIALGREGAHGRHRVAHAAGDATGLELTRSLAAAVRAAPRIEILEDVLALDLIRDRGTVAGVLAVDRDGRHLALGAADVVLATGGTGRLWSSTTNPREATGDGHAIAFRAGAAMADMEFVQFHPTALDVNQPRLPLLTEALRGEGALLVDETGHRFMNGEHPAAELAPRDVVARAIWRRVAQGEAVFLDASGIRSVEARFPTVSRLCRDHGFVLGGDPVPVTPAAHYHMGGVIVDADGRTTVPGLWACGEVARTGLHGANRLASNSLLEAVVFGAAVGKGLSSGGREKIHPVRLRHLAHSVSFAERPWLDEASLEEKAIENRLRDLMWQGAGIERDAATLQRTVAELGHIRASVSRHRSELDSMALVAELVLAAASVRTESRGAHCRTDFPQASSCWRQPLIFENRRLVEPRPVARAAASG